MLFFQKFFEERGERLIEKDDGEISVCCPFEHAGGFETRPSASINANKETFVCYTCAAEGRPRGYSEIGFAAAVQGISYKEARKLIESLDTVDGFSEQSWGTLVDNLQNNNAMLEYLSGRGIMSHTAQTYQLGYSGDGILYPVFIFDVLCNVRTYRPGNVPKMVGKAGVSCLLFPFDHWRKDDRPTLLCAGENDAILARQMGFNAVTTTGGEGFFPKVLLSYFKGRTVHIAYDCDTGGREGGRRVAHMLREAGVIVYIVDLGLTGEKHDKDITDFFMGGGNAAGLQAILDAAPLYNEDMYVEDRNKQSPYVDLWHVGGSAYEEKRLATRVQFTGQFDQDMRVPTEVAWECRQDKPLHDLKSPCLGCSKYRKNGYWELEDENLKDLMYIVEQNEAPQIKWLRDKLLPSGCPAGNVHPIGWSKVIKAVFVPDVDTEDAATGYQAAEQYSYVIGDDLMQDGSRYRVGFRGYAHPKDGGRVYMIVDKAEPSDNELNMFKMTPTMRDALKEAFCLETVTASMMDRAKRMKNIINIPEMNPHPMITHCLDMAYHSPLSFKYGTRYYIDKGFPELALIGDTRTGKTEATKKFQRYVGIGNYTILKNASRAAILGGSEKMPNGSHKVKWGVVPKNHKGFLGLDEMSGIPAEVMSALTDMRSSGIAKLEKMGGGSAPAKTRLFWISNPRTDDSGNSRPLSNYNSGVDVVRELVGADEDIARFDAIFIITQDMALKGMHNEWMADCDLEPHDRQLYRDLIFWVWSRKPEQITWADGVVDHIRQTATWFNDRYDSSFKVFGSEAWTKIARLSAACAGATFSASEDGECLVVTKEHVDFVKNFLLDCYITHDNFHLDEYVYSQRLLNETNDAINAKVKSLMPNCAALFNALITSANGCSFQAVNYTTNKEVLRDMMSDSLVTVTGNTFYATERFRKAYRIVKKNSPEGLVPLTRL